jgi:hypothetical protein
VHFGARFRTQHCPAGISLTGRSTIGCRKRQNAKEWSSDDRFRDRLMDASSIPYDLPCNPLDRAG